MGLAWGGHANGVISSGLHDVPNFRPLPGYMANVKNGSQTLRTDAATQMSGLMQAFFRAFKVVLTLSEGYRSIAIQQEYWRRYQNGTGNLAAYPGTSIHGWGLSADLAINGGSRPTGAYLAWLRENAPKYGFVNDVAAESWHWSYRTDLVTRSIVVKQFIVNPNTFADGTKPPTIPDNVIKKIISGETMAENIKVNGRHQFTVGLEYIHWHSSGQESDVTRKTMSTTDETHSMTRADALKLLRGLGIPTRFLTIDTLRAEGWNDTWSRLLEIQGAVKGVGGIKQLPGDTAGAVLSAQEQADAEDLKNAK